jgi:hypothetical protein
MDAAVRLETSIVNAKELGLKVSRHRMSGVALRNAWHLMA